MVPKSATYFGYVEPAHGMRADRYICFCLRDRPGENGAEKGLRLIGEAEGESYG